MELKDKIFSLIQKRVFWYYFFLITGGLWNLLGWIQDIMFSLSGYILILIGLIAILEQKQNSLKHYLFLLFVFIVSVFSEYIGVNTGMLFGEYFYNPSFEPSISGVPIAIGFAWISTFLGANEFSNKLNNIIIYSVSVASIMTIFDFLMEPAATNLDYWTWNYGVIPIKNYLTWFSLSFIFALVSRIFKISFHTQNLRHLMLAQSIYFILSY